MEKKNDKILIFLIIVSIIVLSINVIAINTFSNIIKGPSLYKSLDKVDLTTIKSTGQSVATLFPIDKIKTQQDAVDILIPKGTPDYGTVLGVSFDDMLMVEIGLHLPEEERGYYQQPIENYLNRKLSSS